MTGSLFDVSGKTALVTGGSRGIGYMIAQGLLERGVKVFITSRKLESCQEAAQQLSQYGDCTAIAADVSAEGASEVVVNALREAGISSLDILINNAGATWGAPFLEFPKGGWDKVVDLNLTGLFYLTQALMPLLLESGKSDDPARVINVGSIDGFRTPRHENYPYSATKAAVHHLTQHLAGVFTSKHVNINAIAPGPFETKMTAAILKADRAGMESRIPAGRVGQPDDIVGATVFLCSKASNFVAGNVLKLDGGSLAV